MSVNGARDQLLAGSAFPLNQDRRTTGRSLNDEIEDLPHLRAAAHDVGKLRVAFLNVLTKGPVLGDEPIPFHGVTQHRQDFVVLERLGNVVEGASLHGRDGAFDRRVRRNHDDGQLFVELAQLLEGLHAIEHGHHDVDNCSIEGIGPCQLEAFGAISRTANGIAFTRQQRGEDLPHDFLVVDDEDRTVTGRRRGVGHACVTREVADGIAQLTTFELRVTAFELGTVTVNRVPWPTVLWQSSVPSCSRTMP